ncbi:hypothetical protein AC579_9089 [Pseudocercospora musae]|uniref:Uncharacterized protein n=1 Tax=Pseudocercospora musae TaxID=113226 RepID=A0A139IF44_9PEZI|nr:hypothetical protein AC579_9089 [Pseudocercospora musae]
MNTPNNQESPRLAFEVTMAPQRPQKRARLSCSTPKACPRHQRHPRPFQKSPATPGPHHVRPDESQSTTLAPQRQNRQRRERLSSPPAFQRLQTHSGVVTNIIATPVRQYEQAHWLMAPKASIRAEEIALTPPSLREEYSLPVAPRKSTVVATTTQSKASGNTPLASKKPKVPVKTTKAPQRKNKASKGSIAGPQECSVWLRIPSSNRRVQLNLPLKSDLVSLAKQAAEMMGNEPLHKISLTVRRPEGSDILMWDGYHENEAPQLWVKNTAVDLDYIKERDENAGVPGLRKDVPGY